MDLEKMLARIWLGILQKGKSRFARIAGSKVDGKIGYLTTCHCTSVGAFFLRETSGPLIVLSFGVQKHKSLASLRLVLTSASKSLAIDGNGAFRCAAWANCPL